MNVYEIAREQYAAIGVDTEKALSNLASTPISVHCWQGDDIKGFLFNEELSGGIMTTGNYLGRARNAEELRADLSFALSLIPGKQRVNIHAIYADTDEKVDLPDLEPRHFASWMDWSDEKKITLDYNASCFSHPMAKSGMTIASSDPTVRDFWIAHCKGTRHIGEAFGKKAGDVSVTNFWFPDGSKDIPVDKEGPRVRMASALDDVFSEKKDPRYYLDSLESKVFGIGAESYTVASHEFSLGYAVKNGISYTLDSGHFHPTEYISDKISSVLLFAKEILLHVSRPVRWDSDHVVIFDDELQAIAQALVRTNLLARTHIGLDYFDASINRIAAWVIGTRNMQKALLRAFLEPTAELIKAELDGNHTARLALLEEYKAYPFGAVYDEFCRRMNVPVGTQWLESVNLYEKNVFGGRNG